MWRQPTFGSKLALGWTHNFRLRSLNITDSGVKGGGFESSDSGGLRFNGHDWLEFIGDDVIVLGLVRGGACLFCSVYMGTSFNKSFTAKTQQRRRRSWKDLSSISMSALIWIHFFENIKYHIVILRNDRHSRGPQFNLGRTESKSLKMTQANHLATNDGTSHEAKRAGKQQARQGVHYGRILAVRSRNYRCVVESWNLEMVTGVLSLAIFLDKWPYSWVFWNQKGKVTEYDKIVIFQSLRFGGRLQTSLMGSWHVTAGQIRPSHFTDDTDGTSLVLSHNTVHVSSWVVVCGGEGISSFSCISIGNVNISTTNKTQRQQGRSNAISNGRSKEKRASLLRCLWYT